MILEYNYFLCGSDSVCRAVLVIEMEADDEVKYQGPVF